MHYVAESRWICCNKPSGIAFSQSSRNAAEFVWKVAPSECTTILQNRVQSVEWVSTRSILGLHNYCIGIWEGFACFPGA